MAAVQLAEGVVRLGSDIVNWFLVADGEGVTVVDTALPRYRPQLDEGLRLLGRGPEDVRAVVLTHAHSDHVGCAETLRSELGVPVYVHRADEELARTAKASGKNEAPLWPYLRHAAAWKLMIGFMRGGANSPRPIGEVTLFEDGETLDVPGRPRVVRTGGHTAGHVVLHFERHDALVLGDLLMEWNALTGRRGPQLAPRALNRSTDEMIASLDKVEQHEAGLLLFGHGETWTQGTRAAVESARRLGPS
jgi:glyoxylase-like metal-dependent hydrolase (beta-lactamase superfamily II)